MDIDRFVKLGANKNQIDDFFVRMRNIFHKSPEPEVDNLTSEADENVLSPMANRILLNWYNQNKIVTTDLKLLLF